MNIILFLEHLFLKQNDEIKYAKLNPLVGELWPL